MATKRKISITMEDAQSILSLFKTCELADRHFKSCQSDLYRRHVAASCQAKNVKAAFERLKEVVEPSEEV